MNALKKSLILTPFNLLYRISPKLDLSLLYLLKKKRRLNLKNPKCYTEKVQWIKLYDKNPLMPICCDKFAVRSFVEKQGLGHLLNKIYWSGFDPEEIPFDDLPEKFVLKTTHGSTFNIIVTDKSKLNRRETVETLKKWLKTKFLPCYGEWFYGIEKPRIIAERFIETDEPELLDYKIHCFNGEPKMVHVHSGRFKDHRNDIYDTDWNYIQDRLFTFENSGKARPRPECLGELLEYARILSKPFLHVRVDFYIVKNRIIFGELTFANGSGFNRILPVSFDEEIGSWLKLPHEQ